MILGAILGMLTAVLLWILGIELVDCMPDRSSEVISGVICSLCIIAIIFGVIIGRLLQLVTTVNWNY